MLLYHVLVVRNKHFFLAINVCKAASLFSFKFLGLLLLEVLKHCEDTRDIDVVLFDKRVLPHCSCLHPSPPG